MGVCVETVVGPLHHSSVEGWGLIYFSILKICVYGLGFNKIFVFGLAYYIY